MTKLNILYGAIGEPVRQSLEVRRNNNNELSDVKYNIKDFDFRNTATSLFDSAYRKDMRKYDLMVLDLGLEILKERDLRKLIDSFITEKYLVSHISSGDLHSNYSRKSPLEIALIGAPSFVQSVVRTYSVIPFIGVKHKQFASVINLSRN